MNSKQTDLLTEQRRLEAERLVAELDGAERSVLVGLVEGMSKRAIAAKSTQSLQDLERTLASLMGKINAEMIADAVRIGLYAQVDRSI